jgi:hypothetical protein
MKGTPVLNLLLEKLICGAVWPFFPGHLNFKSRLLLRFTASEELPF